MNLENKKGLSKTDSLCLKGIAIILLIYHHCFASVNRFKGYTVDFFPFPQDVIIDFSYFCKICVAIFAFITGYGLYCSASKNKLEARSCAKWTVSRLIKTMGGFWIVYIITLILTQTFAGFAADRYCDDGMIRGAVYAFIDFMGLANAFDTPTLCATWWYMSAAIFFIIAIPFLVKFTNKFGFFVTIALIAFIPRVLQIGFPGTTNGYSFITVLLFGMAFAKYGIFEKLADLKWVKNEKADMALKFLPLLALVAVSIVVYNRVPIEDFWELHYAIIPMFCIYFCKVYIVRIPVVKQVLAFFGKHSMNIFLVHTFFRYTFFMDFTYSFKKFWLIALVLFGVSLGVSIVLEAFKKLIRYNKLIKFFSDKVCLLIDKI